jgi:hypothetical protein
MAAIDETVPDPPASQVRHRLRHRAGSFPFAGGPRLTVRSVTPISAAMAKPRGQSLARLLILQLHATLPGAARPCSAVPYGGITVMSLQMPQQRPSAWSSLPFCRIPKEAET